MVALLLSLVPCPNTVDDCVDKIEVNHYHSAETGGFSFSQLIFYDWDGNRFQVVDWRLLKNSKLPVRNWGKRDFVVIWQDGNQLRRVRAGFVIHTWTLSDPELRERQFLPQARRRKLGGIR